MTATKDTPGGRPADRKNPDEQEPRCKIAFYRGACKGCQACVELLPECFGWDEDEEKPFLKEEFAPEARIRECMSYCPEDCIEIEEE